MNIPSGSERALANSRRRRKSSVQPCEEVLLRHAIGFVLFLALGAGGAFAQAAAEYGSATSGMAGSMSGINIMQKAKFPDNKTNSSTSSSPAGIHGQAAGGAANLRYIVESSDIEDHSMKSNRLALEGQAGKDGAKLMLRSDPDGALVRIDGKAVGNTPLLLVVPAGQYRVTMDGTRLEHGVRKVDLLPHETREYLFNLKPVYPTQVEIHLH
jgi:PEGA domain